MAKNDVLLLDGILDDRVANKLPSDRRDEAFEYFAVQQVLKEFDFSKDELITGIVDGERDGGIDAFYLIVNGHLVTDPESFLWPRSNAELRLVMVTCKHHDTFKQSTLDALIASLTEILDFAIDEPSLNGSYSAKLLEMRRNLTYTYRKLSPRLSAFSAAIFYVSRGDSRNVGTEVASRGKQLESIVTDSFGSCVANFNFVGATELIELNRRIPTFTLDLPFVEALTSDERYLLLVRLTDYYSFVSEDDSLRRYLFDSNIRDFMGDNRVNEDIKATLNDPNSTDFWLLNNGVTILATSAAIVGKSIRVNDVQIVNGLQTTESVFRHFYASGSFNDERCVLVKIVVTSNPATRDAIIRATNNQTNVELSSLYATDKIQRDIEDTLLRKGLYYDRRRNFYANQGVPINKIVTPLYLAAGYVALVQKAPNQASKLRSRFMRSHESYDHVFNKADPLAVWPAIASLLKQVDSVIETRRPVHRASERFLKKWRYLIGLLLCATHFAKFDFSANELAQIGVSAKMDDMIIRLWDETHQILGIKSDEHGARLKTAAIAMIVREFAARHKIKNLEVVNRFHAWEERKPENVLRDLTDEFIERVRSALPPQPWKPGMHKAVCAQLNCSQRALQAAVGKLIDDGSVYTQRDGVVFDDEGNVLMFDPDRVDSESMKLRELGNLLSKN